MKTKATPMENVMSDKLLSLRQPDSGINHMILWAKEQQVLDQSVEYWLSISVEEEKEMAEAGLTRLFYSRFHYQPEWDEIEEKGLDPAGMFRQSIWTNGSHQDFLKVLGVNEESMFSMAKVKAAGKYLRAICAPNAHAPKLAHFDRNSVLVLDAAKYPHQDGSGLISESLAMFAADTEKKGSLLGKVFIGRALATYGFLKGGFRVVPDEALKGYHLVVFETKPQFFAKNIGQHDLFIWFNSKAEKDWKAQSTDLQTLMNNVDIMSTEVIELLGRYADNCVELLQTKWEALFSATIADGVKNSLAEMAEDDEMDEDGDTSSVINFDQPLDAIRILLGEAGIPLSEVPFVWEKAVKASLSQYVDPQRGRLACLEVLPTEGEPTLWSHLNKAFIQTEFTHVEKVNVRVEAEWPEVVEGCARIAVPRKYYDLVRLTQDNDFVYLTRNPNTYSGGCKGILVPHDGKGFYSKDEASDWSLLFARNDGADGDDHFTMITGPLCALFIKEHDRKITEISYNEKGVGSLMTESPEQIRKMKDFLMCATSKHNMQENWKAKAGDPKFVLRYDVQSLLDNIEEAQKIMATPRTRSFLHDYQMTDILNRAVAGITGTGANWQMVCVAIIRGAISFESDAVAAKMRTVARLCLSEMLSNIVDAEMKGTQLEEAFETLRVYYGASNFIAHYVGETKKKIVIPSMVSGDLKSGRKGRLIGRLKQEVTGSLVKSNDRAIQVAMPANLPEGLAQKAKEILEKVSYVRTGDLDRKNLVMVQKDWAFFKVFEKFARDIMTWYYETTTKAGAKIQVEAHRKFLYMEKLPQPFLGAWESKESQRVLHELSEAMKPALLFMSRIMQNAGHDKKAKAQLMKLYFEMKGQILHDFFTSRTASLRKHGITSLQAFGMIMARIILNAWAPEKKAFGNAFDEEIDSWRTESVLEGIRNKEIDVFGLKTIALSMSVNHASGMMWNAIPYGKELEKELEPLMIHIANRLIHMDKKKRELFWDSCVLIGKTMKESGEEGLEKLLNGEDGIVDKKQELIDLFRKTVSVPGFDSTDFFVDQYHQLAAYMCYMYFQPWFWTICQLMDAAKIRNKEPVSQSLILHVRKGYGEGLEDPQLTAMRFVPGMLLQDALGDYHQFSKETQWRVPTGSAYKTGLSQFWQNADRKVSLPQQWDTFFSQWGNATLVVESAEVNDFGGLDKSGQHKEFLVVVVRVLLTSKNALQGTVVDHNE